MLMVSFSPIRHDGRVQRACLAAVKAGYHVDLIARNDGSSPFDSAHGVDHHPIGKPRPVAATKVSQEPVVQSEARDAFRTLARDLLFTASALKVMFKAGRPSVVYCHDAASLPVGVIGRYLLRSKLVYDAHEFWPGVEWPRLFGRWSSTLFFERVGIASSSCYIAVSETISGRYATVYGRAPSVIRNIPNSPTPRSGRSYDAECNELLYVGLVGPERGLEVCIDSLAYLPEEVFLTVLGPTPDSDYCDELKRRATVAGVEDRLHFEPPVSPVDVVPELSRKTAIAMILLKTTRETYALGFPNKFFEAVAAGLPVLVADGVVSLAEVVRDGDLGRTCDSSDPLQVSREVQTIRARYPFYADAVRSMAREQTWEGEERKLINAISPGRLAG